MAKQTKTLSARDQVNLIQKVSEGWSQLAGELMANARKRRAEVEKLAKEE